MAVPVNFIIHLLYQNEQIKQIGVSYNSIADRSPLSVNLLYSVPITPHNKAVFKAYHTLCKASIEDYKSDTATKERH
jgi:hypothetical protein